jgi:hypothetical protein
MMIMMGDSVDAKNTAETIFATLMSLMGACLTAMMFGQMANIVAGLDREDKRYEELMGHVKDQVGQLELLPETRDRVVDYYEFQWRINSGMDRAQFLSSLSPCLRIEILLSVYADVVGKMYVLFISWPPTAPRSRWWPSTCAAELMCGRACAAEQMRGRAHVRPRRPKGGFGGSPPDNPRATQPASAAARFRRSAHASSCSAQ